MRTSLPHNAKLVPPQAKRVFQGVFYGVYQWQQELYDGSTATFEMLKRPDTVKVIAIKDDKLVILEQEQPYHELFFDVPGGIHDVESESELEGAKRELLEEAGMRFRNWRLLEVTQTHTKIEHFVYTFLATGFESQSQPTPDAGEKITVQLMPLSEVKALLGNPKARYLPEDILRKASSLEDLVKMPSFEGQPVHG